MAPVLDRRDRCRGSVSIYASGANSSSSLLIAHAAGRDGGLKLMEIERLREKGYRITVLGETRFRLLAGR